MVINGTKGNAYDQFLNKSETAISLVVINGVPRYGHETIMNNWTDTKEKIEVNGVKYHIHLKQATADPVVGNLKLEDAINKLSEGLRNLPDIAKNLETMRLTFSFPNADAPPQWFLVLDHDEEPEGEKLRMGVVTERSFAASIPLSEIVEEMELDKLTVADDPNFLNIIQAEINLPQFIKDGLVKMYQ
jgi:hypothetical protein